MSPAEVRKAAEKFKAAGFPTIAKMLEGNCECSVVAIADGEDSLRGSAAYGAKGGEKK